MQLGASTTERLLKMLGHFGRHQEFGVSWPAIGCLCLGDLIVGILAADIGALVWSLDKDFERMEKLKLIQLYG